MIVGILTFMSLSKNNRWHFKMYQQVNYNILLCKKNIIFQYLRYHEISCLVVEHEKSFMTSGVRALSC